MADAWALEPRLPEEVDSMESGDTCPLCGSPNFNDGYCSVCGYSTEVEESNPIQLDDAEDDLVDVETEQVEEDLVEEVDSEPEQDTTDVSEDGDEPIDEDEDGDLDPSEEDLVDSDLIDDGGSELVYDEDGIMVFDEGGRYFWYIDGTDETGVADTLEDAVSEAKDVLGSDMVEGSENESLGGIREWASRTATRHFTPDEIRELEDEIEGTNLANASRLRY